MPRSTEQAADALGPWGRQTVTFALTLRAIDDGRPPDEPEAAFELLVEAEEIAQNLWAEAPAECSHPDDPGEFEERILRRVFEWCRECLAAGTRAVEREGPAAWKSRG